MSQNTKIIVCYHKEYTIFENETLLPLHVGADLHPETLKNMQGDNTGENISFKNNSYCELTGLYWLWKNIDAKNYGLFHYRRFLDIKNKYNSQEYPSNVDLKDFSTENFDKLMSKFDIILPKRSNFKINLYEHYKKNHIIKDLDTIVEIIKRDYPEYKNAINKALSSKHGYFSNMFIMKKEYFDEYCAWLFDILGKAEKVIDVSDYDSYQKRVLGFLSERMLPIYIQHKKDTVSDIKIKEVRRFFLNDEPLKKVNFIIGNYTRFSDKMSLEIFKLKITRKIGV